VEPGNGDSYRYQGGTVDGDISPDFHLCNRGKLSIVLDSRNEAVTQCPARYSTLQTPTSGSSPCTPYFVRLTSCVGGRG
jgi:hypothetical protein